MNRKMELHRLIKGTTTSYQRYTIRRRAIPRISDGQKPIHRRIMFSMYSDGLRYDKYRLKSNPVAGAVLRFSPHGDASVYGAMVRLANDSVVYNTIDGKGAFSSITSRDVPAGGSRYTEARLGYVAEELFDGINKDAVDFMLTYDEKRKEPVTLPAKLPFILMNPNKGIASGIATEIPSFDLKDLRDNIELLLNGKEPNLMYPTFATGGYVLRDEGVAKQVADTGRGAYVLRARYKVEGESIIITELPYGSTVEAIIDRIYSLKDNKDPDVSDITYINDDTNKDGLQLRIETKKGTDKDNLMKILYQKTLLQSNFSCNLYALDNNDNPKLWGTTDILLEWIKFRADVIKRIALFDITKKSERLNILIGLRNSISILEKLINIIKDSHEDKVVENIVNLGFNTEQAEFIAELKLKQLNKTYIEKQIKSISILENEIADLTKLAKTKKLIAKKIIDDIDSAIEKHYIERQTEILDEFDSKIDRESIEVAQDYNIRVITTKDNYVKKIPLTSLRGASKIKFKDGDEPIFDIETTNSEELLIFTNKQNVYKKKFTDIEDNKPSDLGSFIPPIINLESGEEIISIIPLSSDTENILVGFSDGKVAKISVSAYRTKQNRSVLKNALADKEVLLMLPMKKDEDIDIMSISTDSKTIVMNTSVINAKGSKTTQGSTFQKLKGDNTVDRYIHNLDIEDLEYYRVTSAGIGKFLKK